MWLEVVPRRERAVSAALLVFFAAGCGGGVDVAVPGDDDRVALTGAAELDDDGARLRWSSAGISLNFVGRLRLVIDDGAGTDDLAFEDGGDRFLLRVGSDERVVRGDVVVEAAAPTRLSLIKKTEAFYGAARVVVVVVEQGQLFPAPRLEPLLLVLGDSFATGFGVDGDLAGKDGKAPGPTCPPTPDNMDITKAWPLLVADGVDRDVAVVAWSGRGVLRDYAGDERPLTVPELWATTTLAREPADVVIALGGNDFAEAAPDDARFGAAWRALVDDVPGAPIVVVPQISSDPLVRGVEARHIAPSSSRVVRPIFPGPVLRSGEGCLWHPGTRAHAEYATALLPRLQELLEPQKRPP